MPTVNVYLTFNGNCEEAFNFYKSVFEREFSYIGKFKDMPTADGKPCPPDDEQKIMHVGLPISQETVLMGSDTTSASGPPVKMGNNFSISVTATSREEADKLFNGLVAGGQIVMPMTVQFWGDYFGMCTDKFGINWMVSFNTKA